MGYTGPFVALLIAVGSGLGGYFILRDGELPEIPDQYWGPKSTQNLKQDTSIRPFQINISEKVLTDLKTRLALEVATLDERIEEPLEGIAFEYGMNKNFLKKVTTHWLNKYDWRQREKALNKYPSFKTKISGIDIHFQHVKATKKYKGGTKPLLLLHGWPGSFIEYQSLIPQLVDPKDSEINFDLVIPSLPGYGFSDGARKSGLGSPEMAVVMLKLMKRLGYEKFYVQGGDWGSKIATNMGNLYQENVLGIQSTMCVSLHPRSLLRFGAALVLPQLFMSKEETEQHLPISRLVTNLLRESGYLHLQATKPDTVGIALSYSPSGWAAYILEKFSFWTNKNWLSKQDGGISAYNLDQLLDNVMVHWVGQSITTGLRLYYETINSPTLTQLALDRVPLEVPVSCLNLPHELLASPKFALVERFPNLVRYTQAQTGGHFNAFEIPNVLAKEIIVSFNEMEVVANKPKEKPSTN